MAASATRCERAKWRYSASMWVLTLVLASCQDVAEETGRIEPVTFDPGYPSLHTVPPRPQLSYTIEQRREIVDGLIADRANARYSSDVVRYRAGLSSLPPPAPPALAAVPPEPTPDVPDAMATVAPAAPARDEPVVDRETEFLYEDDDLRTFMEEMVDERIGPPGPDGGGPGLGPDASAAPLATRVIRASADRLIPQPGTYSVRAPVVTLAMPPRTAGLPVPVASHGPAHAAPSAPAAAHPALARRAPGVVWGMPDLGPPPGAPPPVMADASADHSRPAPAPASAGVEPLLAGRAPGVVWGMPDLASPPDASPAVLADAAADDRTVSSPASAALEPPLAARAPGVVWGLPDLPSAPATRPAAAPITQVTHAVAALPAAPSPAPPKPALAPAEIVVAGEAAKAAPPARATPPAPAPIKPARPAPAEIALAGRATQSGVATAATTGARATQTIPTVRPAPASMAGHAPLPAPAKPAGNGHDPELEPVTLAGIAQEQPMAEPVTDAPRIDPEGGLVAVHAAAGRGRAAALGSVPFDPHSARLTRDAVARLTHFLADAELPDARIAIVGEAPAPALALDRALAVGLALVQSGVPADRLELTLARGGSGDQARLFLAAPTL